MPTYRSITISLVSQFDILSIPEFAPPSTPGDPFINSPSLVDTDRNLVSVYIPIYPRSQFWIRYSIAPPHPPNVLYYFKLFLRGAHVVSWGCGKESGYKGKTIFGLFDTGKSWSGEYGIERRILCFTSESGKPKSPRHDALGDTLEVRVYRATGKVQIQPLLQHIEKTTFGQYGIRKGQEHNEKASINLVNAGILPDEHPQHFFKYALLDPLDQPFAIFRYFYRSWSELESIGVVSPCPSLNASELITDAADNATQLGNLSKASSTYDAKSEDDDDDSLAKHAAAKIDISKLICDNPTSTSQTTSITTAVHAPPTTPSHAAIAPSPKAFFFPPPSPPSEAQTTTANSVSRFSELLRRSPSPDKRLRRQLTRQVVEKEGAMEGAGPDNREKRSGSIGILKDVIASARKRRGTVGANSEN